MAEVRHEDTLDFDSSFELYGGSESKVEGGEGRVKGNKKLGNRSNKTSTSGVVRVIWFVWSSERKSGRMKGVCIPA